MSGVSSSAIPLVIPSLAASTSSPSRPGLASPSWRTRGSVGRNMFSANQWMSSGWQASTGELVVGRRTPVRLTWVPTTLFTSVDLPGAGRADQGHEQRRGRLADPGQQVVVDLAEQLGALGGDLVGAGDVEHERDGGDPLVQVQQGRLEQPGVHPDPGPLPLARLHRARPRGYAGLVPGS